MSTLIQKIAQASQVVGGALNPDKRNNQDRYEYVSADKILSIAGQALADAGVVVIPSITSSEVIPFERGNGKFRYDARVEFVFFLTDADGTMEVTWPGYGSDYTVPDKAIYKAITSGHKYFLAKLLNIGAGNEDSEHESPSSSSSDNSDVASVGGRINQGPGSCPKCHAPEGKPHSAKCTVPERRAKAQKEKVTEKVPTIASLDDVKPMAYDGDEDNPFEPAGPDIGDGENNSFSNPHQATVQSTQPVNGDRPRWESPTHAYQWAIAEGYADNMPHAIGSWKKVLKAKFGKASITPKQLQEAFDAYYTHQVAKMS